MDELIKKFLADFDLFLQEKIEKAIDTKLGSVTALDEYRVKELIDEQVAKFEERIEDIEDERMDDQKVRDIVRQMDFSIEIGRY